MATSSDSQVLKGQVTELSETELEAISGGLVNVSLTLMIAEDSSEFASQNLSTSNSESTLLGRQRSLFGLQFSGTFESMDHFSSFLSKLNSFFGRR